MATVLKIVLNEVDECGAVGIWRVLLFLRFCTIAYIAYLIGYTKFYFHWLKGDVDEWLNNFEAEDNKRS